MANVFPTKSNLIKTKKSLSLASLGYELLDRKRNIMLKEMMGMIEKAEAVQSKISATYIEAYKALMRANMSCGQQTVMRIARDAAEKDDVKLRYRSVMGIEVPEVMLSAPDKRPPFGLYDTDSSLDDAYQCFCRVKELICQMTEIESGAYRLAAAIKQTRKRANALKNIVIPDLESTIKSISDYLEEKEREEFTAQKVVKNRKHAD